jgi:hypothetical protein
MHSIIFEVLMTDECVEINCIMAILMTGAAGSSKITVHTIWLLFRESFL